MVFVMVAILLCKLKYKQQQMDLSCKVSEWGDDQFTWILLFRMLLYKLRYTLCARWWWRTI